MDGLTRIVADRLAQRLGQAAIVENKPGANGMIAASAVALCLCSPSAIV